MEIWQFIMILGIPTATVALLFRRFEKGMEGKEARREKYQELILHSIKASIALGEATAEAVQRIPDANCNGEMHAALDYARVVKHEQDDYIKSLAVKAVF